MVFPLSLSVNCSPLFLQQQRDGVHGYLYAQKGVAVSPLSVPPADALERLRLSPHTESSRGVHGSPAPVHQQQSRRIYGGLKILSGVRTSKSPFPSCSSVSVSTDAHYFSKNFLRLLFPVYCLMSSSSFLSSTALSHSDISSLVICFPSLSPSTIHNSSSSS